MSEFIVHGILGSPYVRSVQVALEEKGVPYRFEPIGEGGTKGADHLARHPFGRIPAVEHDGFVLYETQAILRYIDDLYLDPPLTPAEPRQAARVNQLVGIVDAYFFPQVTATICFNRIVAPHFGIPVNEAAITGAIPNAETCLAAIADLTRDGDYLVGHELSLADLMMAPQMAFLARTPEGESLLAPHEGLRAWLGRMEERPSMQRTQPPL